MKHRFIIIGMDDNRSPFFPPEALAQIRKGKVFSGGIRHKEIVGPLLPAGAEWISITVPLDRVFSRYEEIFARFEETATDDSIIVFASGDPLFFGFANTIKRKLPGADILLYPAFNSLQTLAHRLVMPYDDMRTVSLTGRPWQEFDRALIERAPKIGILTDREHTPATIAARMLEYGYSHYTVKRIKTNIFVPMHFAPDYGKANAFRALAETHGTHFIEIKYPGQIIKI